MRVGNVDVPEPDDDPARLAALYSGFAMYDVWRRVVLAACRELIRASAAMAGQKLTEARIEDMSYVHPSFLQFMETHLRGRTMWEAEVQKGGIGG
jgi:hypothetical protein